MKATIVAHTIERIVTNEAIVQSTRNHIRMHFDLCTSAWKYLCECISSVAMDTSLLENGWMDWILAMLLMEFLTKRMIQLCLTAKTKNCKIILHTSITGLFPPETIPGTTVMKTQCPFF